MCIAMQQEARERRDSERGERGVERGDLRGLHSAGEGSPGGGEGALGAAGEGKGGRGGGMGGGGETAVLSHMPAVRHSDGPQMILLTLCWKEVALSSCLVNFHAEACKCSHDEQ